MTRWAIVADLNRCVGCQTCTAACKHANATAPGIQWRKVLDIEAGEFPDVRRAFLPVGCMQCDDAPCLDVCPTTATRKRDDGIVTIDYDLCIGCAYCVMACPYQARSRIDRPRQAFGGSRRMRHEAVREDPARIGVAQKCNFCADRIDSGLAAGLVPGEDLEATPACVGSCIAGALHFGDADDPESNVSRLAAENAHFTMHDELGTGPNIRYLWSRDSTAAAASAAEVPLLADPVGMAGVAPVRQTSWDWRAATNFILGGTGTGLAIAAALTGGSGVAILMAILLVTAGLGAVWLELGRPWRFLNVYLHPQRSWMTREAYAALGLIGAGGAALLTGEGWLVPVTALFAAVFLYCQARILKASKGIPAWRQPGIVPLILAAGLTEGTGVMLILSALMGQAPGWQAPLTAALAGLVVLRYLLWRHYRDGLGRTGAPTGSLGALDAMPLNLGAAQQAATVLVLAVALAWPAGSVPLAYAGALLAIAAGWAFKLTLITRAAFNQGYALNHFPARGAGDPAPGLKPGWSRT